jgi:NAD(P)-dependent dehydrogenase (short-subunit alcohol dehydrogenase family)
MSLLEAHAGMSGKIAVVIGGAAGIGRAVTLALAEAGVSIATCDIDAQEALAIVPQVEALGVKILSLTVDVCDATALDAFYDRVEAEFGRIDILINVAGGTWRGLFTDTTREENEEAIRLNYGYVLDSVRRGVALIRKGGAGGSIVSFTTIEATRGAAGYSVYAGAKAAVANFTRALAVELGPEQIRVNTIAPDSSPSHSRKTRDDHKRAARRASLSPEARAQGVRMYIPQKRAPSEQDLANAVLFLCSDLSRAITGIALPVDGGTSASLGFIEWPFGDGHGPSPQPETLRRLFDGDPS